MSRQDTHSVKRCIHDSSNTANEEWVRSESRPASGTVNGKWSEFRVGGYVVRCTECGDEYWVAVG